MYKYDYHIATLTGDDYRSILLIGAFLDLSDYWNIHYGSKGQQSSTSRDIHLITAQLFQ